MAGDDEQKRQKLNERLRKQESNTLAIRSNFCEPQFNYSKTWDKFCNDRRYNQESARKDFMCRPYLDGWIEIYLYQDIPNIIYLDFYTYDGYLSFTADTENVNWSKDVGELAEHIRTMFDEEYLIKAQEYRDKVYIENGFVIH